MRWRGLTAALALGCLALTGCTDSSGPPEGSESSSSASADGSHIPAPTRPVESTTAESSLPEDSALSKSIARSQAYAASLERQGESQSHVSGVSGVFRGDATQDGQEDRLGPPGRYRVRLACDSGRVRLEIADLRRTVACSTAPITLGVCVPKKPLDLTVLRGDRGRQEMAWAVDVQHVGRC